MKLSMLALFAAATVQAATVDQYIDLGDGVKFYASPVGYEDKVVNVEGNAETKVEQRDIEETQYSEKELAEIDLEKREPVTIAILTAVAVAAAGSATTAALNHAFEKIKAIPDWTLRREAFTRETVAALWAENKNQHNWPAVLCYNMGYGFMNNKHSDMMKFRLRGGFLNIKSTDYDCFKIGRGNNFYTHGDGGHANYALIHSRDCDFLKSNGDVHCKP